MTRPQDGTVAAAARLGADDDRAVREAAGRFGVEVGAEIFDGGSPARVLHARTARGRDVVLKVLSAGAGVVDGHDLESFLGKQVQIRRIRAEAPALADRYLPILGEHRGQDWAAVTTPYYPSHDLAASLREGAGTHRFLADHDAVAEALYLQGYARHTWHTPPDHLRDVHIGRFLRRLPVLRRALGRDVADGYLVVNGVPCQAPERLLTRLLAQGPDRLAVLGPARLMFPAHGDANIRNLLIGTDPDGPPFAIIDPRGATSPWDPVYDLAKALFSLTVWDPALRLGMYADRVLPASRQPEFTVGFRHPGFPGYRAAAHAYPAHLAASPVAELFAGDPGWKARLLLTHALHVLAEAPCRLSDAKARHDTSGRASSPRELALGHYLMGTLLLNDVFSQWMGDRAVDPGTNLGLVTDIPGRS